MEKDHIVTSQGQRDTNQRDWFDYLAHERGNLARELYKLLKSRRCEPQEGPFLGFQSPPDRF